MIYLDNGATSFPKPVPVRRAVERALTRCANPGRGGYGAAMEAAETVFRCRELAGELFGCSPDRVAFAGSCTQALNTAIGTLVKPGERVVISGFEHNAVTRPLHALGAEIRVTGRKLFDWEDTLESFENALKEGAKAAVFTCCSNVFGYILPVMELSALCRKYGVPFVLDGAQGGGSMELSLEKTGAAFIAAPGHKGLLGPQGVGILFCGRDPDPLIYGGTGSNSRDWRMPDFLPDRLEAGTVNVPGIAGLSAGLSLVKKLGPDRIGKREAAMAAYCADLLEKEGIRVFRGPHQSGVLSFLPPVDPEELGRLLAERGICIRAGLHCAPLAHESAGTLETGTVRVSFGPEAAPWQAERLAGTVTEIVTKMKKSANSYCHPGSNPL